MASQYLSYNRNKRSIALDLKNPAARDALERLVRSGDVLIHNMRPPAAMRLGIGYAAISALNPRIVYASAPGFRQDGPYKDRPALDDLIQGMSGVAGMFLQRDGEPAYAPFNLADKLIGYCLASAIGMALVYRERTGEGQEVQVPMLETMLEFNSMDQLYGAVFEPPAPPGLGHPRTLSPKRKPFATRKGYICLQATTNEQFERLFAVIERPDLIKEERFATITARLRNFDALFSIIEERLKTRGASEWAAMFDAADVPNAPMLETDRFLSDAYIVGTGFFHSYMHPTEGELVTPSIAIQFSRSPGGIKSGPPRLGEHTRAILAELGYSDAEIEKIVDGVKSPA